MVGESVDDDDGGNRKLQFQGDVSLYIRELSQIVFAVVKATCLEFTNLFPDKGLLSCTSSLLSPFT